MTPKLPREVLLSVAAEFLAGVISPEAVAEFERHASECPACTAYLETHAGEHPDLAGMPEEMKAFFRRFLLARPTREP